VTDYYPLLARAVSELEDNTEQTREAVYGRARAALLRQLRNGDPPFSQFEIASERLAREDVKKRVEGCRKRAPSTRSPSEPNEREARAIPGLYRSQRAAGAQQELHQ
jgi:hypothetical protein